MKAAVNAAAEDCPPLPRLWVIAAAEAAVVTVVIVAAEPVVAVAAALSWLLRLRMQEGQDAHLASLLGPLVQLGQQRPMASPCPPRHQLLGQLGPLSSPLLPPVASFHPAKASPWPHHQLLGQLGPFSSPLLPPVASLPQR